MKYLISYTILFFCFINIAKTQEGIENIDITQIKTPNSPAAVIIDNQVNAISRPKSWSALEASLFSNYLNQEGSISIPNDFAIEFSPYWAQKDLKLSNEDFLTPSLGQSFVQNLSFSLSSTQNYLLKDSLKSNALGFGIRTMLWQGSKEENTIIIKKYKQMLYDISKLNKLYIIADTMKCHNCNRQQLIEHYLNIILKNKGEIFNAQHSNNEISNFLKEYENYLSGHLYYSDDYSKFSDSINFLNDTFFEIDSKVVDIQKLRSDRKGFKLELATALSLDFPTNEIDFSIVPKIGFWLTPSYQPYKIDWVEFIGVVRYFNYNLDFYKKYLENEEVYEHSFDYGLRLAFKWEKYSLEFEGVGRSLQTLISEDFDENGIKTKKTKNKSDFQYIMNFNYQIKDNIILTYNFGKEFDPVLSYKGNLISLLTLNLAIDTPKAEIIE